MATKILVADDEAAITHLFALVLRQAGFEVIEAGAGAAVLELARSERPDAFLLDVMFPDQDGRDITRELRRDGNFVDHPIVLFSSADEQDIDWRAAGADLFIQKPIDILALAGTMRKLLERRRSGGRRRRNPGDAGGRGTER